MRQRRSAPCKIDMEWKRHSRSKILAGQKKRVKSEMYNRYLPCVSIQASEVEEEEDKKRLDVRACMRSM